MCSISEENSLIMESVVKKGSLQDSLCRRCLENKAQVVLRATDPYCSSCFMSYGSHKFRSTIGKVRAVRANDNVLLAYSGGLASGTMLRLVQQGTEEAKTHRRLIFNSTVVFIDEGELLGLSDSERASNARQIKEFADACCMPSYVVNLSCSLLEKADEIKLWALNDSPEIEGSSSCQLRKLLEAAPTLTAKEDLLSKLKIRLLSFAAEKLGIKKVFLASSGTRLASHLLATVAQGRGAQIGDEIGFTDSRTGVTFLRPMREFVDKEVAYMARFLNIESVSIPALSTKTAGNASIERLMEEFVVKLQVNFPGTISTLFRTGDKLASATSSTKDVPEPDLKCLLCQSIIEDDMNTCSAACARQFSQLVSRLGEKGMSSQLGATDCCSSPCQVSELQKTCCKSAKDLPTADEWNRVVCYGCQLTLNDMQTTEHFPLHLQEEARGRARREKMRQSIEQFLL